MKTPSEVPAGKPFSVNERCCCDPSLLETGSVVGRFYRVVRCLGVGRAGAVYLCEVLEEEDSPPPLVAVKMLFRAVSQEGERNRCFVRFHREVDAIFRIAHPNVVSALQFICHEGQIGYSMDYVAGGTLAQHISTRGPFSENQAIEMLDYLSRGLEAIHRAGVIHRDLKPDNILLTPELQPKISDFGVAFCGYGQRLTAKGSVVGVMQYLSPEYLEKGVITRQGDVYALGALGYELVTGVPPFWGMGLCETIQAKVTGVVPDVRSVNAEISAEFSELIARTLSANPESRFRSAAEFNQALRDLVGGKKPVRTDGASPISRESMPLLTSPVPSVSGEDTREDETVRREPLTPSKLGLIFLAALVVFIGLRWWLADAGTR